MKTSLVSLMKDNPRQLKGDVEEKKKLKERKGSCRSDQKFLRTKTHNLNGAILAIRGNDYVGEVKVSERG